MSSLNIDLSWKFSSQQRYKIAYVHAIEVPIAVPTIYSQYVGLN